MRAVPGNHLVRCRRCEEILSVPRHVEPEKYGVVPTKYGAIVRHCGHCGQLWLGYMQTLPKGGYKIIMKKIDKEL